MLQIFSYVFLTDKDFFNSLNIIMIVLFFMATPSYMDFPRFLFSVRLLWPLLSFRCFPHGLVMLGALLVFKKRTQKIWLEALHRWVALLHVFFIVEWPSLARGTSDHVSFRISVSSQSDPQKTLFPHCSWACARIPALGELSQKREAELSGSSGGLSPEPSALGSSASASWAWCAPSADPKRGRRRAAPQSPGRQRARPNCSSRKLWWDPWFYSCPLPPAAPVPLGIRVTWVRLPLGFSPPPAQRVSQLC